MMNKQRLQELVAQAQLSEALDGLLAIGQSAGRQQFIKEVIHLQSRLRELERGERMGVLEHREAQLSRSQITLAVLSLIEEMGKHKTAAPPSEPQPSSDERKGEGENVGQDPSANPTFGNASWGLGLALLAVILAIWALLPCPNAPPPFDFSVRLVRPNLPDYPPLLSGHLKVLLGEHYERAEFDPDLMATLKGVPASLDSTEVEAELEGTTYWKLEADYVRLSSAVQSLKVMPDGSLDTLFGRVLLGDAPLEGVSIEVEGGLSGLSDASGRFVVAIPLNRQRAVLQINAFKKGYGRLEEQHNPASGEKVLVFQRAKQK